MLCLRLQESNQRATSHVRCQSRSSYSRHSKSQKSHQISERITWQGCTLVNIRSKFEFQNLRYDQLGFCYVPVYRSERSSGFKSCKYNGLPICWGELDKSQGFSRDLIFTKHKSNYMFLSSSKSPNFPHTCPILLFTHGLLGRSSLSLFVSYNAISTNHHLYSTLLAITASPAAVLKSSSMVKGSPLARSISLNSSDSVPISRIVFVILLDCSYDTFSYQSTSRKTAKSIDTDRCDVCVSI
jgi:hypothetical protein